ncbi:MAG: energy transducer TonB [Bacteroidales bacterium]|jgi:protein TonB|nr:energy transducer TonB [Bacteroidales bacterium]
MEQKKTERADLENKRGYLLEIGLVVTLLIMWGVFEWSSTVERAEDFGPLEVVADEEELAPVTRQEELQLPPPPPPQQTVADIIEIVDDKVEVNDDFMSTEADENTTVEIQEVVDVVQEEEVVEEPQVFFIVEDMPEFPGGELALRKYIAENVRYPEMAKENDIQGTVYVRFVVDTDGSVKNVEVIRGVDQLLDKEAIRVVQSLPKWKPGKQRGKAVKVSHSVPIKFQLQN